MTDKKTATRRQARSRDIEQEAKKNPAESGPDDQEHQLREGARPAPPRDGSVGQSDLEEMRGGYPNPEFEHYDRATASDLLDTGNKDGEGEDPPDDVQEAPLGVGGNDPNLVLGERDDAATWAAVREEVRDRLTEEGLLTRGEIEVSGDDGQIVLAGLVPSQIERDAAQACAEGVMGVRHVSNRLSVAPLEDGGERQRPHDDRHRRGHPPANRAGAGLRGDHGARA